MDMNTVAHLLETIMLICFGLSWPINLMKNIKLKSAKPMNLPFILLIVAGYVAGVIAKIIKIDSTPVYLLVVYIFNLVMVSCNIVVYFINKGYDAKNGIK
jgi:hypothetical protein